MIHPHVEETVSALHRAIASAGVGADQLTAVLLVGGSSRIPLVAQMVSEQLGRPVAVDADPKNAIAKGAALSLTPAGISATGAYAPAPARPRQRARRAARGGGRTPGHRVEPVVARAAAAHRGVRRRGDRGLRPHPADELVPAVGADGAAGPAAAAGVRVRRRRVLLRPATTATAQPGRARRRGGCGGRGGRARDGVPVAAARGVDGEPRHGADRRRHHRRRAHHRGRPDHHAGAGRAEAAARAAHGRRAAAVTTTVAPLPTTTEPPPTTTSKPPPTPRSRRPPPRVIDETGAAAPNARTWRPSEWAL